MRLDLIFNPNHNIFLTLIIIQTLTLSLTTGEMLCPADKISLIIGTKGSIINEISRKSNSVISIVDDDSASSKVTPVNPYGVRGVKTHRLILIRGSVEGVEMAKHYISG
jgi:hypothetical protein